jgi:hypothetical protein
MKTRIHALAGTCALLIVMCFWASTLISELFLSREAVVTVKTGILYGMGLLIPFIVAAGGTGFLLARSHTGDLVKRKKRRMPFIALNGLLVLAPAAIFLHGKAVAGEFDAVFYAAQGLELVAGALQLALLGRNFRDGLVLGGRLGPAGRISGA